MLSWSPGMWSYFSSLKIMYISVLSIGKWRRLSWVASREASRRQNSLRPFMTRIKLLAMLQNFRLDIRLKIVVYIPLIPNVELMRILHWKCTLPPCCMGLTRTAVYIVEIWINPIAEDGASDQMRLCHWFCQWPKVQVDHNIWYWLATKE